VRVFATGATGWVGCPLARPRTRRGKGALPRGRRGGCAIQEIAEVIGRRLNVPVISQSPEEAEAHLGWFARFVGIDCPARSEQTRSALGWKPEQPGLIADIDHPAYFTH
jgi:hypothetical protein